MKAAFTLTLSASLLAAAVHAETDARLMSALAAHGVAVNGTMTALWIGDVAGGIQPGGVYNTLGFANVDADLAKLAGWPGAHAFANAAWIRGGSVSSSFVGDALVASNLDGFDSIRLYEAWIEQDLAGHGSVRLGVLGADDEFAGSEGGAVFTNSGFGWQAGIGANVVNGGPIYFVPALGARVQVNGPKGWTARAAVYDGDSFDSPTGDPDPSQHGLHFQIDRGQGAFLISELAHAWGGDEAPGSGFKLGGWAHTAEFADDRLDGNGAPFAMSGLAPAEHHGNHGAYGVLEQRLWSDPHDRSQGIGAWTRLAVAPADRSVYSRVVEAGLRWTGMIPGRNADVIGIGVVSADVSPDARQAVRDQNTVDGGSRAVPDFERVVEASYQLHAGEHWMVAPGVQWVQHPGTTTELHDATVLELRLTRQ
jgi:porin